MLRMLEAQAPAKQTATDTITTLSGRLASATLLEDRRAAILGLRSFAKEYPASVASGSLRDLIASLTKDAEDVDTLKIILETLLMLFNPDERSPEASEDIALWLADEFTQRQENITILLDLLEAQDFYSRLYSLQLLTAISSLRPDRAQDCVLSAPLGTTRLVATLEDRRDAIRNAGLLLLTDLTQVNTELQKLVAFEDAFNRIFALIEIEGGIEQGGILVQDCLSLLANLARYNASNQSLFRETGCVPRLAQLLPGGKPKQPTEEEEQWEDPNKDKNLWGLLAVLRLFLARGSTSTPLNQTVFARHGMVQLVLNLAFSDQTAPPIRAEALYTCADMIRGNATLQESFPQLQVPSPTAQQKGANGETMTNGASKAYIIDALLDLTLKDSSSAAFDARFAACECVKAYCHAHKGIRTHFLDRAIEGHKANEDDSQNIIATLVRGPQGTRSSDAYRFWFSAVLLLHLIQEDDEAKAKVMAVAEGDAAAGEDVTSAIQAMSGNLVQSIRRSEDERITIGYLMLLCGWLFESATAVDDFLSEGSSFTILLQTCAESRGDLAIIRGMCAALIGILYEFSTKDSPIPRRKLQPLLTSKLGRERYLDCLGQLRQHPLVRDFEVLQQGNLGTGDAQDSVIFDESFIDFFKDNYSRLGRAIDRDPGLEINLNQTGVDRDLVDSLRAQIEDKSNALQKAEQSLVSLQQRLDGVEAEHRRTQEQSAAEIARIQQINGALQKNNEAALDELDREHEAALRNMEDQFRQQYQTLQGQLHSHQRQVSEDKGKAREAHDREMSGLKRSKAEAEEKVAGAQQRAGEMARTLAELREQLAGVKAELDASKGKVDELSASSGAELAAAKTQVETLERRVSERDERIQKLLDMAQRSKDATARITAEIAGVQKSMADAEASVKQRDGKLKEAEDRLAELEPKVKEIAELEEAKVAAEIERDDLLLVLADLEEKRTKDKKRLKDLGQDTSDDEEEQDEGDDDGDGDEGEEGDASADDNGDGQDASKEDDLD